MKPLLQVTGRCSKFGGPADKGVSPSEGLAVVYDIKEAPHLFLPSQPRGTTGLARRLNPDIYYIACRWDYNATPRSMLLKQQALVRSLKTGIALKAFPVDWGPHKDTGRIADLSPKLMDDLGIKTDDEVEVIFPVDQEAGILSIKEEQDMRWPADNQEALIDFYGEPGPQVEAQLVPVVPPFKMYFEGNPINSIKFHKKAAGALAAAFEEIWEHYGKDQSKINALKISVYDGAYNPRKIRGSATKWSNHAYGAAIDLDAAHNGFGTGHGTMPQPVIDAFKRQGARWGGDYHGRTDPMHFEFAAGGVIPDSTVPVATDQKSELIRIGDTGHAVELLQGALGCKVTGSYLHNSETEFALKLFQVRHGLETDGVAGPLTQKALNI